MTSYSIELSVINHLRNGYGGVTDFGSPDTFDPKSEDTTDWVKVFCETIHEPPTRRQAQRTAKVRIIMQCYSRTRDTLRPEKKKAEVVAELFRHAVIDVVDHDATGEPVVGCIQCFEPRISDEWESRGGIEDGYSLAMVQLDAIAVETL